MIYFIIFYEYDIFPWVWNCWEWGLSYCKVRCFNFLCSLSMTRAMIALGWMKRNHHCNSSGLQMAGVLTPQIGSFCLCDLSLWWCACWQCFFFYILIEKIAIPRKGLLPNFSGLTLRYWNVCFSLSFPFPPNPFLSRACLGEEDKGIVQIKHKTINSNFSRRAFFSQEWYDSPFMGQTNKEKNWKSHFKSSSHHGSISVTIWKAKTCILLHQKSYIRRYCSVLVKSTYWWLKEGKEKNLSLTSERGNILQMLLFHCRISSKTTHCQRHG